MKKYKISYELSGGIATNPESYTEKSEIRLSAPLREGYRFAGWQGAPAKIAKGSQGNKTYTAAWKKSELCALSELRKNINFGLDDGLSSTGAPTPLSAPVSKGFSGENIYQVKTVYTDIKIDGVKDAAYDYGLHFKSDVSNAPDYYKDKNTGFDAYVVRGQDGRLYVFVEVVDPDVIVTEELWKKNHHHCDGIHMYTDYGLILIAADPTGNKLKGKRGNMPYEHKVVMTDVGYNIEFSITNNGTFFGDGDVLSFAFFMCDCVSYESVENHKKNIIRLSSELSGKSYRGPSVKENDLIICSEESATGHELSNLLAGVEKTGDLITDIISGATRAAFVYGNESSAYTIMSSRSAVSKLNSICSPIPVRSNSMLENGKYESKIFVGMTDDPESLALANKIGYNGYALEIKDNNIYLIGWREEALDIALGMLLSAFEYVKNGGKTADLSALYAGGFGSIPGKNIPTLDSFTTITDAGDGAYCVLAKPAAPEALASYREKLLEAGFEMYASNKRGSLESYTYYDENAVVTVTYDTNEANGNDLRVVVEPRAMTTLPPHEVADYTPVCKSSITQIAPNRMTYVVKLDNGEFLVADSGTNKQHSYIYDELMRLSDDGKPVVAVWTFSHFHQDHNGGFVEFVQNEEYMKNVTIKSVMYNTPEYQLISLASPLDKRNMAKWESLIDSIGATRYQARTGQKYAFANAEIEVLYTYEDLMPFFIYHDRSNPSSFVYLLTIEGQKFVITGDCCSEASSLMVERYGKELRADFVQLPHHGHGDGGTDPRFYECVDAEYVLWPASR